MSGFNIIINRLWNVISNISKEEEIQINKEEYI